jgi:hypothetical protein
MSFALVTVGLGLGACSKPPPEPTNVVTDVDRQRAELLSSDPVLATAVSPPEVVPGRLISTRVGWDRTEVRARLYAHKPAASGAGPTAGSVETELARTLETLRQGGWTIYWTMCLPPPKQPSLTDPMPTSEPMPADVARSEGFQWLAYGYKVTGGVSYWSMVSAQRLEDGDAWVDIVMRAPNARDTSNLFVDRPKALPAGKTCPEDGQVKNATEQAGSPAALRDWYPFPGYSHSPDPQRR